MAHIYRKLLYTIDTIILVDSVRWDTARYQILKVPLNADTGTYGFKYSQLYTAYFNQPVVVDSLFFMAGSCNNNILVGDWYHVEVSSNRTLLRHPRIATRFQHTEAGGGAVRMR